MPIAASATPYSPMSMTSARSGANCSPIQYEMPMVRATNKTAGAVERLPLAIPLITTVAGPVSALAAMSLTGG